MLLTAEKKTDGLVKENLIEHFIMFLSKKKLHCKQKNISITLEL